jgi:hypothetical protein
MSGDEKVFRYKLDFYYQSALIYLVTLILYGGIRGSLIEARFEFVLNDPLMYVIVLFVVMSFVALLLNRIRDRRLIVLEDAIVFRSRNREVRIRTSEMEWMHIGRESRVRTSGVFQVATFKLKGRRRIIRIRMGRYERSRELTAEMHRISARIPGRTGGRWRKAKQTGR